MSLTHRNSLFAVDGQIAVVTGAGSGFGRMMAKALEENGATVYLIGRRQEPLDRLTAQAVWMTLWHDPQISPSRTTTNIAAPQKVHGGFISLPGDITSTSDLARIVSTIKARSGHINLLVANAGVSGPVLKEQNSPLSLHDLQRQLLSTPTTDFTHPLDVNITATFYTIVSFLELLELGNKRSLWSPTQCTGISSQVIATSSITAFNRMAPSGFSYASSKAGVTHMVKQLSTLLGPHRIRCNIIAPGIFPSEMSDSATFAAKVESIPEKRAGDECDAAGAVLFLASRAGAYVNGNVLVLDGGRLGTMPSTY